MNKNFLKLFAIAVLAIVGIGSMWAQYGSQAGEWIAGVTSAEEVTTQSGETKIDKPIDELTTGNAELDDILANGGLIRITNRRSNFYNLADNGSNTVGANADDQDISQVWVLTKVGDGYTIRNGRTGRYLDDSNDFRSPNIMPVTMYIQFSPNNYGTSAWVNISEVSTFEGNVCLNENGTSPEDLYKYYCLGDPGSDWTLSKVTNFTMQQVEETIAREGVNIAQVATDKIYRIHNITYGLVVNEAINGNMLVCEKKDAGKYTQYWRTKINTDGSYMLQNVYTGRYIARQYGDLSKQYVTTTTGSYTSNGFFIDNVEGESVVYSIKDNWGVGLHCDGGKNVVGWGITSAASAWAFEEVNITQAEIDQARSEAVAYDELVKNLASYQTHLDALFADKACTTLKSSIASLSDAQLAANADFAALTEPLQQVVLKVKNNTWQQFTDKSTGYKAGYEKFFRVANYKVYSHHEKMASSSYTNMGYTFGRLSNPTGIAARGGDIVYVFVDSEVSSDCSLALEIVAGIKTTGAQIALKPGLNAILVGEDSNLFVFYQLNDPEKYLANYKDIKVHIEGGRLQGYWDATRGMTNADWKLLQQDLLKEHKMLNLKTDRLVFNMHADLVKAAEPTEMEGLMQVWNTLCANEQRYMGLEEFEGRWNNIWNCYGIEDSYMYATNYGTYYERGTLSSVMNFYNMTHQYNGNQGGNLWGPSHEMGHNHQKTINLVGTTEASNNMFSNINLFEQGISTTRDKSPLANFQYFADKTPWCKRSIQNTTRMFFQLYLYFHAMGNDNTFLPRLFKELRKNPIKRQTYVSGSTEYLHFAKVCCDIAQADMSEFFESYGMFIPVNNEHVGDYGDFYVTTTQAEIDAAKAYMQKYSKKLNNIMFIDDHIATNQVANPDSRFCAVAQSNGLKYECGTEEGVKMGNSGDVGMYTDYTTEYMINGYYYTWNSATRTATIKGGNGAVGFKAYDSEGNLIALSNKMTITIPESAMDAFVIKAAEGNGADIVVPREGSFVEMDVYYSGQEESRTLRADESMTPLPANAVAIVRAGQSSPAAVKKITNVVDENNVATSLVIDGSQAWYLPKDITAMKLSFTKPGTGYSALALPFDVNAMEVKNLKTIKLEGTELSLVDASTVEANNPVVVEGNVNLSLTNKLVKTGGYASTANAYTLKADGKNSELVESATPFEYNIGIMTSGIEVIADESDIIEGETYDLMGRKVSDANNGIFIRGGKKVIVK